MMLTRKSFITAAAFLIAASITQAALASESTIELKGEDWDDAIGQATIKDAAGGLKEIKIDANGLEPNSTFTVWLINETPVLGEFGIGAGDLTFESDSKGHASYAAMVPSEQFKDWDSLQVLHHPNKDPDDIEGSELALKGDLG